MARGRSEILIFILILVFTMIALGCEQKEEFSSVSLTALSAYLGQNIQTTGCLSFSCPTLPGALYPRDCKVFLHEKEVRVPLEFPPGTEAFRTLLDAYYNGHFTSCVRLQVKGMVRETPCDVTGCTPNLFIEVQEITVLEVVSQES
jgi:hypothetical protein